ncbi:hypothetical protein NOLU111490_01140 [Novosphingobium lubricantis]
MLPVSGDRSPDWIGAPFGLVSDPLSMMAMSFETMRTSGPPQSWRKVTRPPVCTSSVVNPTMVPPVIGPFETLVNRPASPAPSTLTEPPVAIGVAANSAFGLMLPGIAPVGSMAELASNVRPVAPVIAPVGERTAPASKVCAVMVLVESRAMSRAKTDPTFTPVDPLARKKPGRFAVVRVIPPDRAIRLILPPTLRSAPY